jgi:hypothetical protein
MKVDANTPEEYIAEFDGTYAIEYCMITLEIALRFEEKSCDKDEVCGLLCEAPRGKPRGITALARMSFAHRSSFACP